MNVRFYFTFVDNFVLLKVKYINDSCIGAKLGTHFIDDDDNVVGGEKIGFG